MNACLLAACFTRSCFQNNILLWGERKRENKKSCLRSVTSCAKPLLQDVSSFTSTNIEKVFFLWESNFGVLRKHQICTGTGGCGGLVANPENRCGKQTSQIIVHDLMLLYSIAAQLSWGLTSEANNQMSRCVSDKWKLKTLRNQFWKLLQFDSSCLGTFQESVKKKQFKKYAGTPTEKNKRNSWLNYSGNPFSDGKFPTGSQ